MIEIPLSSLVSALRAADAVANVQTSHAAEAAAARAGLAMAIAMLDGDKPAAAEGEPKPEPNAAAMLERVARERDVMCVTLRRAARALDASGYPALADECRAAMQGEKTA